MSNTYTHKRYVVPKQMEFRVNVPQVARILHFATKESEVTITLVEDDVRNTDRSPAAPLGVT